MLGIAKAVQWWLSLALLTTSVSVRLGGEEEAGRGGRVALASGHGGGGGSAQFERTAESRCGAGGEVESLDRSVITGRGEGGAERGGGGESLAQKLTVDYGQRVDISMPLCG